jgi:hypothetical protein
MDSNVRPLGRVIKSSIREKCLRQIFWPRVELLESRDMLAVTLPPGFVETTVATGLRRGLP